MTTINKANHLLPDGEAGRGFEAVRGLGRTCLLSATYFGPVQWYQKLNRHRCIIEQHDHFVKQTYRNRCIIATANGPQTLTVPVERGDSPKCSMRDVRISDHGEWRHLHWQALVSAYGETPFFEYYADDLRPFFEKRYTWLLDLDLDITDTVCSLLDVRPSVSLSESYVQVEKGLAEAGLEGDGLADTGLEGNGLADTGLAEAGRAGQEQGLVDLRDVIRPKHPGRDDEFAPRPYYQLWASRHGFLPNMSVLDLLCNEGPEGIFWL